MQRPVVYASHMVRQARQGVAAVASKVAVAVIVVETTWPLIWCRHHDPVATDQGSVICRRCLRHPVWTGRRVRWTL